MAGGIDYTRHVDTPHNIPKLYLMRKQTRISEPYTPADRPRPRYTLGRPV